MMHAIKHSAQSILVVFCLLLLVPSIAPANTLEQARQQIRVKNFAAAHEILQKLSHQGNTEAQYSLAVLYRNGHGIDRTNKSYYVSECCNH